MSNSTVGSMLLKAKVPAALAKSSVNSSGLSPMNLPNCLNSCSEAILRSSVENAAS